MSRIYAVPYTGTLTNTGGNADLFELMPATQKPIFLRGFVLAQSTEVQDAAEEILQLSIIRMTATVTSSNGTSVTPVPLNAIDTAAAFTAEANGATVATTSGTATTIEEFAWNMRLSPFERWYPEQAFSPSARNAEGLFLRNNTTVADDVTKALTAFVDEL